MLIFQMILNCIEPLWNQKIVTKYMSSKSPEKQRPVQKSEYVSTAKQDKRLKIGREEKRHDWRMITRGQHIMG